MLNRASGMKRPFSLKVGCVGVFRGGEHANLDALLTGVNASHVPAITSVNSKKPAGVVNPWSAGVLRVVFVGYITKVFNAVIRRVSVDVVNLVRWPASVGVKPSKPVALDAFPVNLDYPVSVLPDTPSNIANADSVGGSDIAGEYSGFRVIEKQRLQALGGQVVIATSFHHVGDTEIRRVSIEEYQPSSGPCSVVVKPCDLASRIVSPIYPHGAGRSRNHFSSTPRIRPLLAVNQTAKSPGFWIKCEMLAQAFCANIRGSHAVVPYKQWFGQKAARVLSTGGLRHFTLLEA